MVVAVAAQDLGKDEIDSETVAAVSFLIVLTIQWHVLTPRYHLHCVDTRVFYRTLNDLYF